MRYYLAPMEGMTGYVFRNAFAKHFIGTDRMFSPFIGATQNRKLKGKEIRDVLPERCDPAIDLIPQILASRADDFLFAAEEMVKLGYKEVNLNLGCPSGTVVSKRRGSGLLEDPQYLKEMLTEIYEHAPCPVSIKTRVGRGDDAKWDEILAIYQSLPYSELIIHPRCQADFYKGNLRMEDYAKACAMELPNLCYNGDINTARDIEELASIFPFTQTIMIGRGVFHNPGLIEEMVTGKKVDVARIRAFHDELAETYLAVMGSDTPALYKMKEIWCYLGTSFAGGEKFVKEIKKSKRLSELTTYATRLFRECEWAPDDSDVIYTGTEWKKFI